MVVNALSATPVIEMWARGEALQKWEDNEHVETAAHCAGLVHNYLRSLPVGFNLGDKEALKVKTTKYVKDQIVQDYPWYAKLGVAILAIVFFPITLDVIIAWAIVKVFGIHFGD